MKRAMLYGQEVQPRTCGRVAVENVARAYWQSRQTTKASGLAPPAARADQYPCDGGAGASDLPRQRGGAMNDDQKAWFTNSLRAERDRLQNSASNLRKYFPADHAYKATANRLADIYEASASVIREAIDKAAKGENPKC